MSRSFEFPREISLLRRFLLLALLALSGCASTPPPQPSSALPAEGTWLARQAEIQGRDHPGQSGFHLLGASEDAFVARAALIRAAQRSLDIQYYIVHDGLTTRALAYELLKAADRGVRVRILIDDTASDGWDYEIGVLSAHPNIQVRLFNPLHLGRATGITRGVGRLFNLSQQHRRMHNKLWLADGTAAIVGGRNLGDEYFNAKPEMNFTDLDLLGVGPIANQLSHSFDQYWNSAISRPIEDFLWRAPYPGELESARRKLQRYLRPRRGDLGCAAEGIEPRRARPAPIAQSAPGGPVQGRAEGTDPGLGVFRSGQGRSQLPHRQGRQRRPRAPADQLPGSHRRARRACRLRALSDGAA